MLHLLRFRRPKALGARFNLASPEAVFQGSNLRPRFDLALLLLGERLLVGGTATEAIGGLTKNEVNRAGKRASIGSQNWQSDNQRLSLFLELKCIQLAVLHVKAKADGTTGY